MANLDVRCVEQVRDPGTWPRFHQCYRYAVVMDGDKPHCKLHSDEATAERARKSDERFKQKMARSMAPYQKLEELRAELARLQAENKELREAMWRAIAVLSNDQYATRIENAIAELSEHLHGDEGEP